MVTAGAPAAWPTLWIAQPSKLNASPGARLARAGRPAEAQPLLGDGPAHDRDRARGAVVVVEAGLLAGHPAQQPHRRVRRLEQAVARAPLGVDADVRLPAGRVGGEALGEGGQLGGVHPRPPAGARR